MRAPSIRIEPRALQKASAAVLSVVLHVAVLLAIVLFGVRHEERGLSPASMTQLVLIEATDSVDTKAAASEAADPIAPLLDVETQLSAAAAPSLELATDESAATPQHDDSVSPAPPPATTEPVVAEREAEPAPENPSTIEIPAAERSELALYLARRAKEVTDNAHAEITWEKDGKQYSATLTRQPARDGTSLERVIADITSSDDGKALKTRLSMKRLAFSQFTQVVDRWDPFVQLHDDKIVGRFHSNTRFNMTYDSRTAPQFLGKVTTAARSYTSETSGRRRDADIFQGGIETRAERIGLPQALLPFEWAPKDEQARVHEVADDARITFFKDGSYSWRSPGASAGGYVNDPSSQPVYFIGGRGATLYIKGTVTGKVLVYSPERIVIEGSLRYAHDPRTIPDSADYLGLVSDKFVEVASPAVTGRGDLTIEAAIFAGRRFIVTSIDHPRKATLEIYGSLTAGTLSATEPRYATRIDYDTRFEEVRPPGFPSTNRYEVDHWDGQWTEGEDAAEL